MTYRTVNILLPNIQGEVSMITVDMAEHVHPRKVRVMESRRVKKFRSLLVS